MEGNNRARLFAHTPGNAEVPLRRYIAGAVAADERGGYALGCTLPPDTGAMPAYYPTPEAMLSAFVTARYRSTELLLHGADFDMKYFLPQLERMVSDGYETTFIVNAQGKIMHVRIGHHRQAWYIRDTFALLPLPLGDLCQLAGYTGEYAPLPLDPYNLDGPPLEPMLHRDCRIILGAYKAFASTVRDSFGVRPSWTAGGTAMRSFLTTLPTGHVHYRMPPDVEAFSRRGYFGALNFITDTAPHDDVTYIDVNAMYAHAMRQGVPTMGALDTQYEIPGAPGLYNCTVTCPPRLRLPVVPTRGEETRAVTYPRTGTFDTVLYTPTIELARELGYTVVCGSGVFWDRVEGVFDTFVSRCEELEQRFHQAGARVVIKGLRNSLYGKFGQKEEGVEYALLIDPDPADGWTEEINGFDGSPIDNFYSRDVHIDRPYMMPHWAGWITANARNVLARAALALSPQAVYYGDNDSIMLDTGELHRAVEAGTLQLGSKYGEWKVAKHYTRLELWGKKRYRGITDDGEIVYFDVKWAGVPRGVMDRATLDAIVPGGAPVPTPPYLLYNRAVDTAGGRSQSREAVQYIEVPALRAWWQDDDATVQPP